MVSITKPQYDRFGVEIVSVQQKKQPKYDRFGVEIIDATQKQQPQYDRFGVETDAPTAATSASSQSALGITPPAPTSAEAKQSPIAVQTRMLDDWNEKNKSNVEFRNVEDALTYANQLLVALNALLKAAQTENNQNKANNLRLLISNLRQRIDICFQAMTKWQIKGEVVKLPKSAEELTSPLSPEELALESELTRNGSGAAGPFHYLSTHPNFALRLDINNLLIKRYPGGAHLMSLLDASNQLNNAAFSEQEYQLVAAVLYADSSDIEKDREAFNKSVSALRALQTDLYNNLVVLASKDPTGLLAKQLKEYERLCQWYAAKKWPLPVELLLVHVNLSGIDDEKTKNKVAEYGEKLNEYYDKVSNACQNEQFINNQEFADLLGPKTRQTALETITKRRMAELTSPTGARIGYLPSEVVKVTGPQEQKLYQQYLRETFITSSSAINQDLLNKNRLQATFTTLPYSPDYIRWIAQNSGHESEFFEALHDLSPQEVQQVLSLGMYSLKDGVFINHLGVCNSKKAIELSRMIRQWVSEIKDSDETASPLQKTLRVVNERASQLATPAMNIPTNVGETVVEFGKNLTTSFRGVPIDTTKLVDDTLNLRTIVANTVPTGDLYSGLSVLKDYQAIQGVLPKEFFTTQIETPINQLNTILRVTVGNPVMSSKQVLKIVRDFVINSGVVDRIRLDIQILRNNLNVTGIPAEKKAEFQLQLQNRINLLDSQEFQMMNKLKDLSLETLPDTKADEVLATNLPRISEMLTYLVQPSEYINLGPSVSRNETRVYAANQLAADIKTFLTEKPSPEREYLEKKTTHAFAEQMVSIDRLTEFVSEINTHVPAGQKIVLSKKWDKNNFFVTLNQAIDIFDTLDPTTKLTIESRIIALAKPPLALSTILLMPKFIYDNDPRSKESQQTGGFSEIQKIEWQRLKDNYARVQKQFPLPSTSVDSFGANFISVVAGIASNFSNQQTDDPMADLANAYTRLQHKSLTYAYPQKPWEEFKDFLNLSGWSPGSFSLPNDLKDYGAGAINFVLGFFRSTLTTTLKMKVVIPLNIYKMYVDMALSMYRAAQSLANAEPEEALRYSLEAGTKFVETKLYRYWFPIWLVEAKEKFAVGDYPGGTQDVLVAFFLAQATFKLTINLGNILLGKAAVGLDMMRLPQLLEFLNNQYKSLDDDARLLASNNRLLMNDTTMAPLARMKTGAQQKLKGASLALKQYMLGKELNPALLSRIYSWLNIFGRANEIEGGIFKDIMPEGSLAVREAQGAWEKTKKSGALSWKVSLATLRNFQKGMNWAISTVNTSAVESDRKKLWADYQIEEKFKGYHEIQLDDGKKIYTVYPLESEQIKQIRIDYMDLNLSDKQAFLDDPMFKLPVIAEPVNHRAVNESDFLNITQDGTAATELIKKLIGKGYLNADHSPNSKKIFDHIQLRNDLKGYDATTQEAIINVLRNSTRQLNLSNPQEGDKASTDMRVHINTMLLGSGKDVKGMFLDKDAIAELKMKTNKKQIKAVKKTAPKLVEELRTKLRTGANPEETIGKMFRNYNEAVFAATEEYALYASQLANDYAAIKVILEAIQNKDLERLKFIAMELVAGGGKTKMGLVGLAIIKDLMKAGYIENMRIVYVTPKRTLAEQIPQDKGDNKLMKMIFDEVIVNSSTSNVRFSEKGLTVISYEALGFAYIREPELLKKSVFFWDEYDKFMTPTSSLVSSNGVAEYLFRKLYLNRQEGKRLEDGYKRIIFDAGFLTTGSPKDVHSGLIKLIQAIDKYIDSVEKGIDPTTGEKISPHHVTAEELIEKADFFKNRNLPNGSSSSLKSVLDMVYCGRGAYGQNNSTAADKSIMVNDRFRFSFRLGKYPIGKKRGYVITPDGEGNQGLKLSYPEYYLFKLSLENINTHDNPRIDDLKPQDISNTLMQGSILDVMHKYSAFNIGVTGTLYDNMENVDHTYTLLSELWGKDFKVVHIKGQPSYPTLDTESTPGIEQVKGLDKAADIAVLRDLIAKSVETYVKQERGRVKIFLEDPDAYEKLMQWNNPELCGQLGIEKLSLTLVNKPEAFVDRKSLLEASAKKVIAQNYDIEVVNGRTVVKLKTASLLIWDKLSKTESLQYETALLNALKEAVPKGGDPEKLVVDFGSDKKGFFGSGVKTFSAEDFVKNFFNSDIGATGNKGDLSRLKTKAAQKGVISMFSWASRGTDIKWIGLSPYIGIMGLVPRKADLIQAIFRGPRGFIGGVVDYYYSFNDVESLIDTQKVRNQTLDTRFSELKLAMQQPGADKSACIKSFVEDEATKKDFTEIANEKSQGLLRDSQRLMLESPILRALGAESAQTVHDLAVETFSISLAGVACSEKYRENLKPALKNIGIKTEDIDRFIVHLKEVETRNAHPLTDQEAQVELKSFIEKEKGCPAIKSVLPKRLDIIRNQQSVIISQLQSSTEADKLTLIANFEFEMAQDILLRAKPITGKSSPRFTPAEPTKLQRAPIAIKGKFLPDSDAGRQPRVGELYDVTTALGAGIENISYAAIDWIKRFNALRPLELTINGTKQSVKRYVVKVADGEPTGFQLLYDQKKAEYRLIFAFNEHDSYSKELVLSTQEMIQAQSHIIDGNSKPLLFAIEPSPAPPSEVFASGIRKVGSQLEVDLLKCGGREGILAFLAAHPELKESPVRIAKTSTIHISEAQQVKLLEAQLAMEALKIDFKSAVILGQVIAFDVSTMEGDAHLFGQGTEKESVTRARILEIQAVMNKMTQLEDDLLATNNLNSKNNIHRRAINQAIKEGRAGDHVVAIDTSFIKEESLELFSKHFERSPLKIAGTTWWVQEADISMLLSWAKNYNEKKSPLPEGLSAEFSRQFKSTTLGGHDLYLAIKETLYELDFRTRILQQFSKYDTQRFTEQYPNMKSILANSQTHLFSYILGVDPSGDLTQREFRDQVVSQLEAIQREVAMFEARHPNTPEALALKNKLAQSILALKSDAAFDRSALTDVNLMIDSVRTNYPNDLIFKSSLNLSASEQALVDDVDKAIEALKTNKNKNMEETLRRRLTDAMGKLKDIPHIQNAIQQHNRWTAYQLTQYRKQREQRVARLLQTNPTPTNEQLGNIERESWDAVNGTAGRAKTYAAFLLEASHEGTTGERVAGVGAHVVSGAIKGFGSALLLEAFINWTKPPNERKSMSEMWPGIIENAKTFGIFEGELKFLSNIVGMSSGAASVNPFAGSISGMFKGPMGLILSLELSMRIRELKEQGKVNEIPGEAFAKVFSLSAFSIASVSTELGLAKMLKMLTGSMIELGPWGEFISLTVGSAAIYLVNSHVITAEEFGQVQQGLDTVAEHVPGLSTVASSMPFSDMLLNMQFLEKNLYRSKSLTASRALVFLEKNKYIPTILTAGASIWAHKEDLRSKNSALRVQAERNILINISGALLIQCGVEVAIGATATGPGAPVGWIIAAAMIGVGALLEVGTEAYNDSRKASDDTDVLKQSIQLSSRRGRPITLNVTNTQMYDETSLSGIMQRSFPVRAVNQLLEKEVNSETISILRQQNRFPALQEYIHGTYRHTLGLAESSAFKAMPSALQSMEASSIDTKHYNLADYFRLLGITAINVPDAFWLNPSTIFYLLDQVAAMRKRANDYKNPITIHMTLSGENDKVVIMRGAIKEETLVPKALYSHSGLNNIPITSGKDLQPYLYEKWLEQPSELFYTIFGALDRFGYIDQVLAKGTKSRNKLLELQKAFRANNRPEVARIMNRHLNSEADQLLEDINMAFRLYSFPITPTGTITSSSPEFNPTLYNISTIISQKNVSGKQYAQAKQKVAAQVEQQMDLIKMDNTIRMRYKQWATLIDYKSYFSKTSVQFFKNKRTPLAEKNIFEGKMLSLSSVLFQWCQTNNKRPKSLTKEELALFLEQAKAVPAIEKYFTSTQSPVFVEAIQGYAEKLWSAHQVYHIFDGLDLKKFDKKAVKLYSDLVTDQLASLAPLHGQTKDQQNLWIRNQQQQIMLKVKGLQF